MAANFGELVLVCGDLHIPQRGADIPVKVRERKRRGGGWGRVDEEGGICGDPREI